MDKDYILKTISDRLAVYNLSINALDEQDLAEAIRDTEAELKGAELLDGFWGHFLPYKYLTHKND